MKFFIKVRVWIFVCCFGIGLNVVINLRIEFIGDIIFQGDVIGKY